MYVRMLKGKIFTFKIFSLSLSTMILQMFAILCNAQMSQNVLWMLTCHTIQQEYLLMKSLKGRSELNFCTML
jgi:hypothetical protein